MYSTIIFYRNTFFKTGFLLEFPNFPLVGSIFKGIFSPILFVASIFDFHHCECTAYSCAWGQSSFRSFLLNPSRRTNGLKGNQKDETPSFANAVCVLRLYRSTLYPRVPVFHARLFSTFRFFCSTTRCGKIHRG